MKLAFILISTACANDFMKDGKLVQGEWAWKGSFRAPDTFHIPGNKVNSIIGQGYVQGIKDFDHTAFQWKADFPEGKGLRAMEKVFVEPIRKLNFHPIEKAKKAYRKMF